MLAAACCAAAAGCGGDDGPTRATWSGQANAVCAEGTRSLEAVRGQIDAASRASDAATIFRRTSKLIGEAVDATRPRVDRLDGLVRPAADDEAIATWLMGVRRQLALTEQLAGAFGRQDRTAITRLSVEADRVDRANDDRAAALGLTACVALS